jgi:methylmalonyl-CoA/ethylmalonyl-CoA epimerase
MFEKVHHVSYLVGDLSATIDWYVKMLQGKFTGRGTVPGLGDVGFVQVGGVELEFIEPEDKSQVQSGEGHVFHHVAYVVEDLDGTVADLRERGYEFATPEPFVNFMGYRLIYFEPWCTGGARVHLTEANSLAR